jgi:hypothetical protein
MLPLLTVTAAALRLHRCQLLLTADVAAAAAAAAHCRLTGTAVDALVDINNACTLLCSSAAAGLRLHALQLLFHGSSVPASAVDAVIDITNCCSLLLLLLLLLHNSSVLACGVDACIHIANACLLLLLLDGLCLA